MKRTTMFLLMLALVLPLAHAQTTTPAVKDHFINAGVTFDQESSRQFSAVGTFGKCILHVDDGQCSLYSLTTWDISPFKDAVTGKWKAQYSQRTGAAYVITRVNKIAFFILGDLGGAETQDAVGFAASAGGGVNYALPKDLMLTAAWRNLKTTNDNNYKILHFMVGWRF